MASNIMVCITLQHKQPQLTLVRVVAMRSMTDDGTGSYILLNIFVSALTIWLTTRNVE